MAIYCLKNKKAIKVFLADSCENLPIKELVMKHVGLFTG